jgi:hypothetical protein
MARRPHMDGYGARTMMAEALATGRQLATPELLALLLAVMEAEPRRAPDDVVELVRREVERLAGGEGRETGSRANRKEER